jgi:hypothetical protein
MRTTIRNPWAASLLLGALAAGLLVTPALAAARFQPDGLIRFGPSGDAGGQTSGYQGPWLGNHIYNANGAGQTTIWPPFGTSMLAGTYFTFDISIRNAGTGADRFKVKATGAATRSWIVTYSRGTTSITSAVVAGTYRTPLLAPGATYVIHAKIYGVVTRLVTIRSIADPTKLDAVKFGLRSYTAVP